MACVVICSLVRDGISYISSYRRQLESLKLDEGDSWHLCLLEGDSSDATWQFLQEWANEDLQVTLGKQNVGDSAELEDRSVRWARAGNACIDLIPKNLDYTHLLWLEADLSFPPELLRRLLSHKVDVVAPVIWLGGYFYDTWGFRDLKGNRWTNLAPYHPEFQPMHLMEMGSVGSCVLFRRDIIESGIRFRGTYENGLLVGMCNDSRAMGYQVYADTSTAILHPVDNWEAQMWRPYEVVINATNERPIKLSIGEAKSLGFEMNVPTLDPKVFLHTHSEFLRNIAIRHGTNRISAKVEARGGPPKRYRFVLTLEIPTISMSWCRRILAKWNRKMHAIFLRKHFQCSLNVEIKD